MQNFSTIASYQNPEQLPENLKGLFDVIGESEKVVDIWNLGKFSIIRNGVGDKAIFSNELLNKCEGTKFLPWGDSPLFSVFQGGITVLANCDFPEKRVIE